MSRCCRAARWCFELRKTEEGVQRIRIYYVTQTLDDMRNGDPVFAVHPPTVAPIFIPGCSAATPGYDAPLDRLRCPPGAERLTIDPQFRDQTKVERVVPNALSDAGRGLTSSALGTTRSITPSVVVVVILVCPS